MNMDQRAVATAAAPQPAARYSQGIVANGFVFVAGQGGFDPYTGELAHGVEAQTQRAFENVRGILEEAGTSLGRVVKISVFLADLGDFQAMNRVYESFVSSPAPVRTTVEAGLAPGMDIEIDATALA
jgi:2-iminobutanoate/2-iminopropanoate deaminase